MDILLEQLVYGSFPFWDRGYDVLARSPGCRADWVAEVLAACRRFGEAPAGVTPAPALFSVPLASGPRAIVGVEPQGADDRGRPGALAFHALLVDPRDYRKAGANPFAFAGALRRDWSSETTLGATFWTVETPARSAPSTDPRALRVVESLARGRRVALESGGPIDDLARSVWPSLPDPARRRASVATWAFGNANRFDLVALPRLAGVEFDRSYVDPASIDEGPAPEPGQRRRVSRPALGTFAVAVLAILLAAWRGWRGPDDLRGKPAGSPSTTPEPAPLAAIDPEREARIGAELRSLADRLEVGGSNDPGDLMVRLASQFHYRGPTLSTAELARLRADPDPDRDRALAWHARITATFADDRPLPGDFASLPRLRQLDRLNWSFHLPPSADLDALLAALSREGPIRPTPLAARYPPLSDYARFLGKLPRKE